MNKMNWLNECKIHNKQLTSRNKFNNGIFNMKFRILFASDQIDWFTSLRWVSHARSCLVLLVDAAALAQKTFTILRFLFMLDNGAASTANCSSNVFDTVALEVVLFANRLALHRDRDTGNAEAGGTTEQQALL